MVNQTRRLRLDFLHLLVPQFPQVENGNGNSCYMGWLGSVEMKKPKSLEIHVETDQT